MTDVAIDDSLTIVVVKFHTGMFFFFSYANHLLIDAERKRKKNFFSFVIILREEKEVSCRCEQ
jgi:hypothetical protein